MSEDERNLNLLAIFHYVVGGLTAFFACFPLIHIGIGIAILCGAIDGQEAPPRFAGVLLIVFGAFFILCGWALAAAIIIAGRKLHHRQSRTYCIVVAALECMLMPFGTVLGVLTIIVLMKRSVQGLFAGTENRRARGVELS